MSGEHELPLNRTELRFEEPRRLHGASAKSKPTPCARRPNDFGRCDLPRKPKSE